MCGNLYRDGDLTVAEYFDRFLQILDDAGIYKTLRRDLVTARKTREGVDIDDVVLRSEDVREAAEHRHSLDETLLASLEAGADASATSGVLSLEATTGIRTPTASVSTALPPSVLLCTLGWA